MEFLKQNGAIWHPIYTLPRNERKVFASLDLKGFSVYLPMRHHINIHPVISKGKNYCYKRDFVVPMFPGYLFAQIPIEFQTNLNLNRSVIKILPISEFEEDALISELNLIQKIEELSKNEEFDIRREFVRGTRVCFTEGNFVGWEGVVVRDAENDGFVFIHVSSVEATIKIKYPAMWCRVIE